MKMNHYLLTVWTALAIIPFTPTTAIAGKDRGGCGVFRYPRFHSPRYELIDFWEARNGRGFFSQPVQLISVKNWTKNDYLNYAVQRAMQFDQHFGEQLVESLEYIRTHKSIAPKKERVISPYDIFLRTRPENVKDKDILGLGD